MPKKNEIEFNDDIYQLVQNIRENLTALHRQTKTEGRQIRFNAGPIEMELNFVTTKTKNGKIGYKLIEAGKDSSTSLTHKIKLTFNPIDASVEQSHTDSEDNSTKKKTFLHTRILTLFQPG